MKNFTYLYEAKLKNKEMQSFETKVQKISDKITSFGEILN
jgi:hypothetical protein